MPIFRRKDNHDVTVEASIWRRRGDHSAVVDLPPDHSVWDAAGGSIAAGYGYFPPTKSVVVPGDYIVRKPVGESGVFHALYQREIFESVWEPVEPDQFAEASNAPRS